MRKSPRLFRLATSVALTALLWDTVLPLAALAQPAPPPLPALGGSRPDLNQTQGDPPERVGRIARMTGAVSFHNLGDTQWSAATPNYPVSSGNAFWTEPSAETQLEISASRIAMAGGTEFDVATLDASGLQGVAAQGEIYLRLRNLVPNEVWSIQTPRGLVQLGGEGRYVIVVGTTEQPTLVTVIEGAAQIEGPGVSLQVAANQTATITGTDTFQATVGPAQRDTFLTARLEAERPPPAQAAAVPSQAVYAMAGGSDLVDSGSWSQAPDYGQVWYPPVPATWVPYREGHWAFVAPWGWTWIDDAPWGFAPFHYGRWIQIGGRWAWTPGAVVVTERPVYAPALVTFIGIGAGVALGAALASGSIGWVPLGPREQFHPWYHASNNYIRQVNVSHVTNITNNVTINNFVNRGAATSIPAAAMAGSRPVQGVARPITRQEFAAARPIAGQQPIRPTAATAGVTPVVARQFSVAPAPAGAARFAPGPAVRPVAAGGSGFARPTFAPAERTQAPGGPPGATQGRPGANPAIVPTPGARPNGAPGANPAVVPGARPGVVPTPEAGRPTTGLPPGSRPGEPNLARPEAVRPPLGPQTTPRPGQPNPVRPGFVPGVPRPGAPVTPGLNAAPVAPRVVPQPATPVVPRVVPQPAAPVAPRVEQQRVAPVAPHIEPQRIAPVAPRIEPQRVAPVAPRVEPQHVAPVAPRVEQQHFAPPAPRVEPQRVAPPAPRPAPPPRPEPQERKKQPGER